MPCPLQDTQRDHTAGTRLELSPLGTRLPALYAPLVLTGAAHCLNVGADPLAAAALRGRSRQAVSGNVWGAVSDDQHVPPPAPPAPLRPVGIAAVGPKRWGGEPAVRLAPTETVPPIVTNAVPQGVRRSPGLAEDRGWGTAPPLAGSLRLSAAVSVSPVRLTCSQYVGRFTEGSA